jgi:hypothetical protein
LTKECFSSPNLWHYGKLTFRSVKAVKCFALHEELKVILQQGKNQITATSPGPDAQAAALGNTRTAINTSSSSSRSEVQRYSNACSSCHTTDKQ